MLRLKDVCYLRRNEGHEDLSPDKRSLVCPALVGYSPNL